MFQKHTFPSMAYIISAYGVKGVFLFFMCHVETYHMHTSMWYHVVHMKKNTMVVLVAVAGLGLFLALFALLSPRPFNSEGKNKQAQNDAGEYQIDPSDFVDASLVTSAMTGERQQLTEAEREGLLLMREEEKLARDVYNALGEQWGLRIFTNIAKSEQTHTDAMAQLLAVYGVENIVATDTRGHFENQDLQVLYTMLVEKGSVNVGEALVVGARIEDLDIYDLERLMQETDKQDILAVYANLQKGSRNHLRAFIRQIEQQGGTYTPEYLSEEEFSNILTNAQERGRV